MPKESQKPVPKSTKNLTTSQACKEAFLRIVEPELLSWKLERHPNRHSYYRGNDRGYRWDFADVTDPTDVRIVAFSIINPGQQLIVAGRRGLEVENDPTELPIVWGNDDGVFRLTRKWSIRRPLTGFIFKFERTHNQSIGDAADALMGEVKGRLPKLRDYLYC